MAEGFKPFLPRQPPTGPPAQQPFPNPPIQANPTGLRQGMPTMNPQAQMAGHMSPQHFSHLPMHPVPEGLRSQSSSTGSQVEISDIRGEWAAEAKAREELSTIIVMRLEKIDRLRDVDQDAPSTTSTWDRVKRFRLADIPQSEARHRVKLLDQETKSVSKKKEACGPAVQCQLERAQESLDLDDLDKRYCHTLVQFDSKTRPLEPALLESAARYAKGKKGKKLKLPTKERVAITAYFKRWPTSEQSSVRMLKELQMEKARPRERLSAPSPMGTPAFGHPQPAQVMPQRAPQVVQPKPSLPPKPQVQQQQQPRELPKQPQVQQQPKPSLPPKPQVQQQPPKPSLPKQPQAQQQQQARELPKQPQGQQQQQKVLPRQPQGAPVPPPKVPLQGQQQKVSHQEQQHIVVEEVEDEKPSKSGKEKNKDKPFEPLKVQIRKTNHRYPDSARSSRSSFDSLSSSSSISDSSTLPSSVGSSSGASKHHRGRGRSRGRSRTPVYRDEPEHFDRREKGIHVERRRYPDPHLVRIPSSQGSSTRDSPYPSVHDRDIRYNSRTAPPPRVVQVQNGVRHIAPPKARREVILNNIAREEDQIQRMRLNAAYRGEDLLREGPGQDRLDEALRRRRALKDELHDLESEEERQRRRDRENELQDIPWRKDDAADYMAARSKQWQVNRPLPVDEGRRR